MIPASEGGISGYAATLEIFHQMHCLVREDSSFLNHNIFMWADCHRFQNRIRQYIWKDWYEEHLTEWPQRLQNMVDLQGGYMRPHITHCLDSIRIALLCYADVTPVLVYGTRERLNGTEHNVLHKCRNYEKIMSWHKQHAWELEE